MRKRRGKRPVKPNLTEALKDRVIDLKGAQFSSMNIPIVYRRTFDWSGDSVLFRPINKRAFVVQRGELQDEELNLPGYSLITLGPSELPGYYKNRNRGGNSEEYIDQLREALTSFSLLDRFVNIDLEKPKNKELDKSLRGDLEALSTELGYNYTGTSNSYRCTFIFPKYSNQRTVTRCVQTLASTLEMLDSFQQGLSKMDLKKANASIQDVSYSVSTAESNVDRYYTEALNVIWDLPQMEPAGYFLIIQSIERIFDEIEYIVESTRSAAALLSGGEIADKMVLWDMLVTLWDSSVHLALKTVNSAAGTVDSEDPGQACLEIIGKHRRGKVDRPAHQMTFLSQLTKRLESSKEGGYTPLVGREHMEVLHHIFGINQSSARIEDISSVIATTVLYLNNSQLRD